MCYFRFEVARMPMTSMDTSAFSAIKDCIRCGGPRINSKGLETATSKSRNHECRVREPRWSPAAPGTTEEPTAPAVIGAYFSVWGCWGRPDV